MNLHHLVLFTLLSLSLQAYVDDSNDFLEPPQLLELVYSHDESILSVEPTGEIYFKPSHLTITDRGLYLRTASRGLLQIPALLSNQKGAYTVMTDATVYPIIRCKSCNTPFSPTIFNRGKCPRCGTQN